MGNVVICMFTFDVLDNEIIGQTGRLVPETFSFGIWCFVFAGIISATFSPYPVLSFEVFAVVILVPVLLFAFLQMRFVP